MAQSHIMGPIDIFRDVHSVRAWRKSITSQHNLESASKPTIGLVPTMGALHEGHMSLVRQAARENKHVVVSIYVNPTQFGVHEDLDSYPRTWDADIKRLEAINAELGAQDRSQGRVSAVFAPTSRVMYPVLPPTSAIDGHGSFVTISPLGQLLEGASRPVFFRGVATVCLKLFNIIAPDTVYFGQKDVQQTVVIKRMVRDFHLDLDVKIGPTLREHNGLAMSSRNAYLGSRRFLVGAVLSRALRATEERFARGERSRADLLAAANQVFSSESVLQQSLSPSQRALFVVDYLSLADLNSMEEVDEVDGAKGAILSAAMKMMPLEQPQATEDCGLGDGTVPVRLIDNIILNPRKP